MQRMSSFAYYLRTGRRARERRPVELKFNHWHDSDDGRFTFVGQGKYFGRAGASIAHSPVSSSIPRSAKVQAPNARSAVPKRLSNKPAPDPLADMARSAKPRRPGPGQDSLTPLTNAEAAVERIRRERLSQPRISSNHETLIQKFKQHMIPKEGDRNDVYPDNRQIPTVGIGHKVVPSDGLKLGDWISDTEKDALWRQDSAKALQASQRQLKEAGLNDTDFLIALADVNFQLGDGWRAKFKKTWKLILNGDYVGASREVTNSRWANQTPDRVIEFQKALLTLSANTKKTHGR